MLSGLLLLVLQSPPTVLQALDPVPAAEVHLQPGFWLREVQSNRTSLAVGYRRLEEEGAFRNFRIAAGEEQGPHSMAVYTDSDCYKWLEAACEELARQPDPGLRAHVDEFTSSILAAQEADGYLMTQYQIEETPHYTHISGWHELYCQGHLIEAALAHERATGRPELFDAARRLADLICATFPERVDAAPGHPEIEHALVRLYRRTGERRYLDQAQEFLERRGREPHVAGGDAYRQDTTPLRQQTRAEGHAVRALYLYTGFADWAQASGDRSALPVLETLWRDVFESKSYVTGGIGARANGEAFGEPFELPNRDAYSETCAAVASVMWNRRLLSIRGETRFADVMERSLYNNVAAGVSQDGTSFFYVNPLESDGQTVRQPWFACACCPPNVMRTFASIGGDFYAKAGNTLYLVLYGASEVQTTLPSGERAHFRIETRYPWDGRIEVVPLAGNQCHELALRKPEWCRTTTSPAADERGWIHLHLNDPVHATPEVTFPMPVEVLVANPAVLADRGKVALQRGPLVYCFESTDNPQASPLRAALAIDEEDPGSNWHAEWKSDLPGGGAMVLIGPGHPLEDRYTHSQDALYQPLANAPRSEEGTTELTAIPYYLWDNRGAASMRVWMPRAAE